MPRVDKPLKTRNRWLVLRSLVFQGPDNAYALGRRIELAVSIVQDAFVKLGLLGYTRYLFTDGEGIRLSKVHGPTLEGYVLTLTGRPLDLSGIRSAAHQFLETSKTVSKMPPEWPPGRLDYDILNMLLGKWDHFHNHDVEECALKMLRSMNLEQVRAEGLLNIFYLRAWERLIPWDLQRWNKMLLADKDLESLVLLGPEQTRQLRQKLGDEKLLQLSPTPEETYENAAAELGLEKPSELKQHLAEPDIIAQLRQDVMRRLKLEPLEK